MTVKRTFHSDLSSTTAEHTPKNRRREALVHKGVNGNEDFGFKNIIIIIIKKKPDISTVHRGCPIIGHEAPSILLIWVNCGIHGEQILLTAPRLERSVEAYE